jgi:hypothetical protein
MIDEMDVMKLGGGVRLMGEIKTEPKLLSPHPVSLSKGPKQNEKGPSSAIDRQGCQLPRLPPDQCGPTYPAWPEPHG